VGSLVGSSPSGASITVDRANLVYDPKAVNLDFDLQFSGFGRTNPVLGGGVQLPAGSPLTPASLFRGGQFQQPNQQELQQGLLFMLPGQPPRHWDELSQDEQNAATQLLTSAATIIQQQISGWNDQHLTPETLSASYHLDLNRFVKVQSAMKILTRRLTQN